MFTIRADNLIVQEGDSLEVVDRSQGHMVKIRTYNGKEGFVPVLSCLIPSADKTISNLINRLEVELLGNWTECLRKVSARLSSLTQLIPGGTTTSLDVDCHGIVNVGTLIRRLGQTSSKEESRLSGVSVAGLTKALNAFQVLYDLWRSYRSKLEDVQRKNISIYDNLNDFRQVANNKPLRCYETKFTVESTETREEITHTPGPTPGRRGSGLMTQSSIGEETWNQSVESEQLVTSSQEEKHCFVIRAVRDPLTNIDVSLDEAIRRGIINQETGQYVNPATGHSKPIPFAMNEGLIQVTRVTSTKSAAKTEAIGLITVRERVELKRSRGYTLISVLDLSTGETVDVEEASRRGLLDVTEGVYTLSTTGEKMSIDAAIAAGYLTGDYDVKGSDVTAVSKTYAVSAVVDQISKTKVSFGDAMKRHLIDRDTGDYIHNVTGEHINVVEAINRGFFKAKIVEDPSSFQIDAVNHVVVERLAKMKSLVTGVAAISALQKGAKWKK